jgi:hypothetical protein
MPAGADSWVGLPKDGYGKKVRALQHTVAGETVQSNVIHIADKYGNVIGTNSGALPTGSGKVSEASSDYVSSGTGTVGPIDVTDASSVQVLFKNKVAATPWGGAPQVLLEQSDDNVTWTPLYSMGHSGGATATMAPGAGVANTGVIFTASIGPAVTSVRARVTTGPTSAQGMTVKLVSGSAPAVSLGTLYGTPSVSVTQISAGASGGWSVVRRFSTADTNIAVIKGSAGQIGGWYCQNTTAAVKYLKLYNKTTNPTIGTDVPAMTVPLPVGFSQSMPYTGIAFGTGMSMAIVGGYLDADATALATGDLILGILFK